MNKNNLKRSLVSNFKLLEDYNESKILVKNKNRGANYVSHIMITQHCFKELCMISKTNKAITIRKYYILADSLLNNYLEKILLK